MVKSRTPRIKISTQCLRRQREKTKQVVIGIKGRPDLGPICSEDIRIVGRRSKNKRVALGPRDGRIALKVQPEARGACLKAGPTGVEAPRGMKQRKGSQGSVDPHSFDDPIEVGWTTQVVQDFTIRGESPGRKRESNWQLERKKKTEPGTGQPLGLAGDRPEGEPAGYREFVGKGKKARKTEANGEKNREREGEKEVETGL